jgi:hypothetical protein
MTTYTSTASQIIPTTLDEGLATYLGPTATGATSVQFA